MSYLARGAIILLGLCLALTSSMRLLGVWGHGEMLLVSTEQQEVVMADVNTGITWLLTSQVTGSHFQLSPDGRYLTFTDGGRIVLTHIPDGTSELILTTDVSSRDPIWSPDAQRIVFIGMSDSRNQLYMMDSGGAQAALLSPIDANDFAPQWSPDGRQIAFVSLRNGYPQLYVMDVAGGGVRQLTRNRYIDYFAWSPSGDYVAYVARTDTDTEIFSVRVDDGVETNLSHSGAHDYLFDWSPDGGQIVFTSMRNRGQTQLYAVNTDGTGFRALSEGRSDYELLPLWSPDGQTLAFFCGPRLRELDICLMDREGQRQVLSDTHYNNFSPSWSPDAQQLAFLSTRAGSLDLYVTDVAQRGSARRLTVDLNLVNAAPMWVP
ncbi:MAG: hypothetical protein U0694_07980 [Anaerolineae bacterium]